MLRPLTQADTVGTLELLRARPVCNVFLEYVVSLGLLGRVPGFLGWIADGRVEGVLMIGPLGGSVLEVRDADAYPAMAECASRGEIRPRHVVGSEDVSLPFYAAYQRFAPPLIWSRREPVYVLDARGLEASGVDASTPIERAGESDLDAIVEHSALQHREDLKDDRYALDPPGFRDRHLKDIRDGRWWVTREARRIVFQVHVGAENAQVVQVGGVMTAPDVRNRGHAMRGMAAIAARLLHRRPAIGLFCDEGNAPARRVYERVGFEVVHHNQSFLLDEPLCGVRPAD